MLAPLCVIFPINRWYDLEAWPHSGRLLLLLLIIITTKQDYFMGGVMYFHHHVHNLAVSL